MLRIYPVILAFVGDVCPFIERIGRHDPDLAKQLRRASASVALNTHILGTLVRLSFPRQRAGRAG